MAETSTTNPDALTVERRGRIPFVTAPPLLDIAVLLALIPLWWALSADQMIWAVGGLWVALRMGIRRRWRVHLPRSLILLACFLLAQAISALFIVEAYRYITFVRTFGAYVGAFCIALVLVNEVKTMRDIRLILGVLIGIMALMAVLGVLAEIGLFRPAFTGLIGRLLPASVRSTDYGTVIATRELGNPSWFSLFQNYYRLSGFFLYPTDYAPALMFIIPLALYWLWRSRVRIVWAAALLLFAVNLVYTTGRTAMVALAAGFVFFMITAPSRWRRLSRIALAAGIAVVALGLIAATVVEKHVPTQITTLVNDVVLARGEGSLQNRGNVYVATLENAVQRPIFGWGTERDLPELNPYPAGSHDYYLGVLYKYGLVGLAVFAALWIVLWGETAPPHAAIDAPLAARDLARLLSYGRWIIIGALVNSLSEVLDLDATLLVFLWVIIALLICARQQLQSIVLT